MIPKTLTPPVAWPRTAIGMLVLATGLAAAAHHPLSPALAAAWVLLWTGAAWRNECCTLWAVPAVLPWASLAPWTGWMLLDESDLMLAGLVAGGALRRPAPTGRDAAPDRLWRGLPWLWGGLAVLGLGRVLAVVPWPGWNVYADQADVLNVVRVSKSLFWVAALWPALATACRRDGEAAWRAASCGMLTGLAVVVAAGLAERMAFTGLWDFSSVYRITATFWEMHVGGAAIDAYLVFGVPFLVDALRRTRSRLAWLGLAILAVATAYVGLVTYSRGVYVGVAVALATMATWLVWQRQRQARARSDWRRPAGWMLVAVILVEIAVVLAGGTFMASRWLAGDRDMGGRLWHWRLSLQTLDGPADLLLGIGPGQFPRQVAALGPAHELPGRARLVRGDAGDPHHVRLSGPATREALAGFFLLGQRVSPPPGVPLRARLLVRAPQGGALEISVCERHLLYVGRCRHAVIDLQADAGWRQRIVFLGRWGAVRMDARAWRPVVFGVAALTPGVDIDVAGLALLPGREGATLLRNGDFAGGLAHWWPMAQYYFLPWHVDNLYLELLIERGLLGLVLLGLGVVAVVRRLLRSQGPSAACLLGALCGVLCVGLVSSVMDVPRVALLCLASGAWALCSPPAGRRAPDASPP